MAGATRGSGHWNDPETVERFAVRDADVRLTELLAAYEDPVHVRVLDLGCAGGRNAELLAARGFDLEAIDLAPAMVAATRERVARHLGAAEAERRVREGTMLDLSRFADGRFPLVVALGVLHLAETEDAWETALSEVTRVLAPDGLLLVSNFAPGTGPLDAPLEPVAEGTFLHHGFRDGSVMALKTADALDADFAARGLVPEVATKTVQRETDDSRRVTVNALYRKRGRAAAEPR